jgi:hypothetical protein
MKTEMGHELCVIAITVLATFPLVGGIGFAAVSGLIGI